MRVDVVKGASAGAVGVWLMDVVTWAVYRRQSSDVLDRERRARPFGKDPAHAAAEWLARLTSAEVRPEPNALGLAVHYQLGMLPAVVYARVRRRLPWLRAGRGALYGLLLFVVNDELAGRALRIAGPQRAYPWQAHARGLVGHVTLGVVTEATLNLLEEESPGADGAGRTPGGPLTTGTPGPGR